MLRNVCLIADKGQDKKALLAFLQEPVKRAQGGEQLYPFSNLGLAVELVRQLNTAGYIVDVIEWSDKQIPRQKTYDLFVGHGSVNFTKLIQANTFGKILYFATGSSANYHNAEANKRARYFLQRHGVKYASDRPVNIAEQKVYARADQVVCLGNEYVRHTFPDPKKVTALNIAVTKGQKIYAPRLLRSKKHLLFFSGGGNLHKGLDLAIDAVIDTDIVLHVCTSIDPKFRRIFEREYGDKLKRNVVWHGFVSQRSLRFRNLIRRCQFAILLSCSEGSPGSLIDVMQYGLIPIVTPACGLDVEDVGFVIKNIDVDTLREKLLEITARDTHGLRAKSKNVIQLVERQYSLEGFQKNLQSALGDIA